MGGAAAGQEQQQQQTPGVFLHRQQAVGCPWVHQLHRQYQHWFQYQLLHLWPQQL
jgi:hypothetical protein